MFGFLDLFAKQVNEQIAEYATAQARIVRRALDTWQNATADAQPVRIETASLQERRLRHLALRQDRPSRC